MHAAQARRGRRGSVVRQAVLRRAWSRQNRGYPFGSVQVMTTDNEASILSASFFVMQFEVMNPRVRTGLTEKQLPLLSCSKWTNSYFCATGGGVTLETLKRYVEGQKGQ